MPTSDFVMFGMPIHLKYDYVGFLVILVITTILVIGIKESANFTTAIVILKVAVVCMFIALAVAFLASHAWKPNYWHPFIPPNTGTRGEFGWSGNFARRRGRFFRLHRVRCSFNRCSGTVRNPRRICQ